MSEPGTVRYLRSRDQVVSGIQDWILRHRPGAGDALPPDHELGRALGAPAATIRRACGVLEAAGVLEQNATGGWVVAGERGPALGTLLRLHVSLSGFALPDLLSVRLDLERASAARAATDGTAAEVARLKEVADRMRRDNVSPAEFGELDCAFHLALARAGHNHLAELLLTSLSEAMREEMRAGYGRRPDWSRTAGNLAAEHEHILAAVQAHDPAAASEAVARHISGFYQLRAG